MEDARIQCKEDVQNGTENNFSNFHTNSILDFVNDFTEKYMQMSGSDEQCAPLSCARVRACARTQTSETAHTHKFAAHRHILAQTYILLFNITLQQ